MDLEKARSGTFESSDDDDVDECDLQTLAEVNLKEGQHL
jgi:hypothetical protein